MILPAAGAIFLSAVVMSLPVGPVQLEVWREAMSGRGDHAAALISGAALVETGWVLIAVFGMNPWSVAGMAGGGIDLFYAAVLILVGGLSLRGRRGSDPISGLKPRSCRGWAFLRGAGLVAFNPLLVVSWGIVLAGWTRLGVSLSPRFPQIAVYAVTAGTGVSIYPGLIAIFGSRIAPRLPQRYRAGLPRLLGAGIIAFGVYFLYRAVRILAWP